MTQDLTKRIFEDLYPQLESALKSDNELHLYDVVPQIQNWFNESHTFNDDAMAFLQEHDGNPQLIKLKHSIAEATQRMEISAQKCFIERLKKCTSNDDKIEIIRMLGTPQTDMDCPIMNFERLPELQDERTKSGIDENSTVLILGTGSISISGLFYATFGAKVILLDRDPRAYETFRAVYDTLPDIIKNRIIFETACDARDYAYPKDVTHVFMAALLEPKEDIVKRVETAYRIHNKSVTLLMRTPRKDLMQLFYYDIEKGYLSGFEHTDVVDMGYVLQTSITHILKLKI